MIASRNVDGGGVGVDIGPDVGGGSAGVDVGGGSVCVDVVAFIFLFLLCLLILRPDPVNASSPSADLSNHWTTSACIRTDCKNSSMAGPLFPFVQASPKWSPIPIHTISSISWGWYDSLITGMAFAMLFSVIKVEVQMNTLKGLSEFGNTTNGIDLNWQRSDPRLPIRHIHVCQRTCSASGNRCKET